VGGDLILALWVIPKNRKPDWAAGKKAVERLRKRAMTGKLTKSDKEALDVDGFSDGDSVLEYLPTSKDIDDVRQAFQNDFRDASLCTIPRYNVLISGGLSWGDDPTETFTQMRRVEQYGISAVMGFI
jgi:hypothetical protein